MTALTQTATAAGAFFLLTGVAAASCLRVVEAGTKVIVTRFGRVHRTLSPGLHGRLPFAERFEVIRTGFRSSAFSCSAETADQLKVTVSGDVRFTVRVPLEFLSAQSVLASGLPATIQAAVGEVVSRYDLDQLIGKRGQLPQELRFALDDRLAFAGVVVEEVQVTEVAPRAEATRLLAEEALAARRRDVQRLRLAHEAERRSALLDQRLHELRRFADAAPELDDRALTLARLEFERELLVGAGDRRHLSR